MMPDKYDRSFDRSLLVTMNEDADMAGELEHTLPSIYSITGHRRDADVETLFQLRIEGKDGRQAWVPESAVQEDSEMALFAYWDSVADGRLGAMAHKDLWHPFRIEGHRKTHRGGQLLVYWVGSPDRSWQYERVIRKAGPKLVKDYRVSLIVDKEIGRYVKTVQGQPE
ncbi:hypothetical protein CaCOL14_013455 [Colletotrichum acutatum]